MKKLLYLGFCLVLMAGFGCAITDFGIITDNNQTYATGKDADENLRPQGVQPVISTGKSQAHIIETSQVATIWPDGTDELFTNISQKADGTATLYTYNNFSTGSEPIFHDDLYCNTDFVGCALAVAPDNNDADLFDYTFNTNCSGARSLSVLLSTGRYYGECGSEAAKLSVQEKIGLLDSAVAARAFGRHGLLWNLDSSNTSITVRNLDNGTTMNIPFFGSRLEHFFSNSSNLSFTWLDHAMVGVALRDFANKLDNELDAEALEVSISHHGITTTFTIASNAGSVRWRANKSF